MKWLTISQIERRSKTAKGALKVSYEHWNQLYTATAKELRAEYARVGEWLDSSDYCGLCTYYAKRYGEFGKCHYCLFAINSSCGGNLWGNADDALEDWISDRGNWHAWKRACKALRDKLKELMET